MIRATFDGAADAFRSAARSAVDVDALLAELCRVLVDVGGFSLAWVGVAEHDEARTVRPLARAGIPRSYVDDLRVSESSTSTPCGSPFRLR